MLTMPCLVIAEVGVNHNGSEKLAFQLIDAAKAAGADIVKFQTFKAKNLVTPAAKQAEYQIANTGRAESQLAMLSRLELSHESHYKLRQYCDEIGIEFLSTAFDHESLDFLVNKLGVKRLKIPSGEITNLPLVLAHAKSGLDMIVSTGMSTLAEIESVLGVIAFGYISNDDAEPSNNAFVEAYRSEHGQRELRRKVTILHCTTEYPASLESINLNAIDTIANAFGLSVGYSDHSAGILVPAAAAAKKACMIEKHLTLDKTMHGPDHKASIEPEEFTAMVFAIRDVELMLGDGVKEPKSSEIKNISVARKSLVAAIDVAKGEVFHHGNLVVMRPGDGLSPANYWTYLGQKAKRSYKAGDLINE
jgi:N-acetylneuraminate synthase